LQVSPEAYDVLLKFPLDTDFEDVVKKVVEKRRAIGIKDNVLTVKDFDGLLPEELVTQETFTTAFATEVKGEVEIMNDPTLQIATMEAADGFRRLLEDRYVHLLAIAKRRPDVKISDSISSVKSSKKGEKRMIAGLLNSRRSMRNGIELTLEDPGGIAKVLCRDGSLSRTALSIPLDCLVVAELSRTGGEGLFATRMFLPDIPDRKPVTASRRVYAVLLSDLHIGSRVFLDDAFNRFVLWLNGKLGDGDIISRIKYVMIAGDVIDGVGVYPGQENQLVEINLKKQYLIASKLLEGIPKHMDIVISPGNHDPVRQALPQPALPVDLGESLYKMENVRLVGNPAFVRLHGVTFLIFHGRSLDDIIATTPNLSYRNPASAMELLLRARHLAPTYGKRTALAPESRDMLIIDPVPDVFHAGHVHVIDTSVYRGTLLVNSGTWQGQTSFQANMGLEPTPGIVPIIDLASLEIFHRNFNEPSFSHQSGA
jgi:DNA polymerase II small subunit